MIYIHLRVKGKSTTTAYKEYFLSEEEFKGINFIYLLSAIVIENFENKVTAESLFLEVLLNNLELSSGNIDHKVYKILSHCGFPIDCVEIFLIKSK